MTFPGTITDAAYAAVDNNAGNTGATHNGFCLRHQRLTGERHAVPSTCPVLTGRGPAPAGPLRRPR